MKLIVKYYDEWGSVQYIPIEVSSKGRVLDIKKAMHRIAKISEEKQLLYLLNGKALEPMDETNFLSQYRFTKDCIVVVKHQEDEFTPSVSISKSFAQL